MLRHASTWFGNSPSLRAIACTIPLALVAGGIAAGAVHSAPDAPVPVAEQSAWADPPQVGCGALAASGDVDTTCATGVRWEYIGEAAAQNNLGPRTMSYFRGSDGSLKVISRADDPNAEVQVQVGIQAPGQERYTYISQRLNGGGMRIFNAFHYQESGAYSMTVHDLTGREPWKRMVRDYKEDGQTLRRSVAYLRDGTINVSSD